VREKALGRLLSLLERQKRPPSDPRSIERLLREIGRHRFRDAESLIRFHEALLFLRAHPPSRGVARLAEALLGTIARRVAELEADGADLSAFDRPAVAGIAGTQIGTDFSYDLARWLVRRHPRRVSVDWEACDGGDRMRATWPHFLPLLEEEALADAGVPYLVWLAAAAGRRRRDALWILERYGSLPEADPAERYDTLGVPLLWDLGATGASRTLMRLPSRRIFIHRKPFLSRREVSLEREFAGPRLEIRRLSRREGERLCDRVRETTAARYREFYTFTYADPSAVFAAHVGRGVEIFLIGTELQHRLPLRSGWGGFVVKNGVPIGYIEGLAFLERLEIGFNLYYTFRDGESAFLYGRVLQFHRDLLGVTSFSVDPYQLGRGNPEAIASGAFWFYRKLGFRPTLPEIARLLEREEARLSRDPEYRSSEATLRRLVAGNLLWEAPGSSRGDFDRFHIRKVGLAVQRRMASRFGGDAGAIRERSSARVARALGVSPARWPAAQRHAFGGWALVLDLLPDLKNWPSSEKEGVVSVIRAKAGRDERRYLRLLQRHRRLREALLRLGSR
jgi:hypothetical protein